MDWLEMALEQAQKEGRNPSLTELIEISEYLKEIHQRNAKLNARGTIEDILTMAENALRRVDETEAAGPEITALRSIYEFARKEAPHD